MLETNCRSAGQPTGRFRWRSPNWEVRLLAHHAMRFIAAIFGPLVVLTGCQTEPPRRPIDPETFGLHPTTEMTAAEQIKLEQAAFDAFVSTFGKPLPSPFRLDNATGWFTDSGKLGQLRTSAKLPRSEFKKLTASKGWREIPLPNEYLSAMHLPSNVPKGYMTCYIGQVNEKPAYLFWSDYEETTMLVVDY